jgi:tetratricopeptide (TPR) repeat protein
MVQASDGTQKFSHTYEYDIKDPFVLEEQIGGALTSLLKVRLYPNLERLSPEARELFWQAEEEGRQQSPQSLRESAQMMERVARIAPGNPQPLLSLASNYVSLAAFAGGTKDDGEKAKSYLRQAFKIAPDSVDGHSLLGFIKCRLDWDWVGAEREFQFCIHSKNSGNLGYATAIQGYSSLLLDEGRIQESRAQLDLGTVTDPLDFQIPHIRSLLELFGGDLRQAEAYNETALRLMPANPTRLWRRGQIRSLLGRHAEAVDDLRHAVEMTGSHLYQGALGWALARAGQRQEARRILARIILDPSISAVEPARIYAGLAENNSAIDWLEKACAAHDPVLDTIWMDPFWRPLHGLARYQAVVAKVFPGVRLTPPPQ